MNPHCRPLLVGVRAGSRRRQPGSQSLPAAGAAAGDARRQSRPHQRGRSPQSRRPWAFQSPAWRCGWRTKCSRRLASVQRTRERAFSAPSRSIVCTRRSMVRAYEKDARIARILFFAGCAFLPWVWILLLLRYRADLVAKAPYAPGQEQLKKCECEARLQATSAIQVEALYRSFRLASHIPLFPPSLPTPLQTWFALPLACASSPHSSSRG